MRNQTHNCMLRGLTDWGEEAPVLNWDRIRN